MLYILNADQDYNFAKYLKTYGSKLWTFFLGFLILSSEKGLVVSI